MKIDGELQDKLRTVLDGGISEDAMKAVKKATDGILYEIESDLMYRLKDELAPNLVAWVSDMAQRAVEQLLEGNEDQMRRYLSCEKRSYWNGRSDASDSGGRRREAHEWHQVIHGSLFEQGCVELRKKIVDAHRELLVNERILDLEDQVRSLVAQVNKEKAQNERLGERLRYEHREQQQ